MSEFRIFIGSSSESRHIVSKVLQIISEIQPIGELTAVARPWYANDVFTLGDVAIETVEREAASSDLAIFIFADDDELTFRHNKYMCPRDNVVFEAGLFMGKLGRKKVFLLIPTKDAVANGLAFKSLSDLAGLNVVVCDTRDLPGSFSREVVDKIKGAIINAMEKDLRTDGSVSKVKKSPDLALFSPIKDYSKIIPKSLSGGV